MVVCGRSESGYRSCARYWPRAAGRRAGWASGRLMALRPSIRFDVFKRDGFSCAYCGRKPPAVILEVDHVIPVADGGGDEYENLVTSCWDCNRGKGAKQLDERAPTINVEEQTELIWERERQLRAFHEAKREQAERRESQFGEVWD